MVLKIAFKYNYIGNTLNTVGNILLIRGNFFWTCFAQHEVSNAAFC